MIKNYARTAWLLVVMQFFVFSQAKTNRTLYINGGTFTAVDGTEFPYLAFNNSPSFNQENERIIFNAGDTLSLKVINTDTLMHGCSIKGELIQHLIAAGDSVEFDLTAAESKAFIYHDQSQGGKYAAMGLSGMIIALNPNSSASSFYWNMKDHQASFNDSIAQGKAVDWRLYSPQYFTINSRSNPHINSDANARVTGSVGDTILIYMVNTGVSIHSIHFHGYHCSIVQSSKEAHHKGRSKDTFPVFGGELVVLELIPHQPGEFPVHDHNLVAVTGGGYYPNGMFSTILIQ